MKRHRIDCVCGKKAVACGTKGQSIVYYCHNCCKQTELTQELTSGKERTG